MKKLILLLVIATSMYATNCLAQDSKKVKTKFEEVKEECVNLPLEQRTRMVVSRFNVSTPSATSELGDNMGTMLTNALTEINCFRMMEMLKNADDWKGELNYGKDASKERNNRAQVIVNGEITEFTKQQKSGGALMVKSSKEIVKLGFIIKLINPETRDILFSKSINVEGKASGGTSVALFRSISGGINLGSGENKNQAVANALEQGIIQAAEYIGSVKDKLFLPEAGGNASTSTNNTSLTVLNTDFDRMSGLETKLKAISNVKKVDSSFNDGTAIMNVEHKGTIKELLDALRASCGNTIEIKGMDTNAGTAKISMK